MKGGSTRSDAEVKYLNFRMVSNCVIIGSVYTMITFFQLYRCAGPPGTPWRCEVV